MGENVSAGCNIKFVNSKLFENLRVCVARHKGNVSINVAALPGGNLR